MKEKMKLYMFASDKGFYASSYIGGESDNAVYFTKKGLDSFTKRQYYKSLKSLAIALRNAGYHAVNKTQ